MTETFEGDLNLPEIIDRIRLFGKPDEADGLFWQNPVIGDLRLSKKGFVYRRVEGGEYVIIGSEKDSE